VFEMNDNHLPAEQNGRRQAKRDQACKKMGHLFVGVHAHHNAAKLFPRLKAAM